MEITLSKFLQGYAESSVQKRAHQWDGWVSSENVGKCSVDIPSVY